VPEFRKQLPAMNNHHRPFWEAARRHELVVRVCRNCGTLYAPNNCCTRCDRPDMSWARVSGKGKVFTFCVFRRAFHPAWQDDIPYNTGYVKLDEGPVLITSFVECRNEDLYVGMPVEVVFDDINDEVSLPKFRPLKQEITHE